MALSMVLALVLVGAGACLQGSVGFGMNLVAAPLLIAIDPGFVPGPLLLGSTVVTLLTLFRHRRAVRVGRIGWAFVGRLPGTVLGAAAVVLLSGSALALALAGVVLLAVAANTAGVAVPITRTSLVSAGAISGFTGTTTAVGGPPLALLLQHDDGDAVRGNLAGFFLLGSVVSLLALFVAAASAVALLLRTLAT